MDYKKLISNGRNYTVVKAEDYSIDPKLYPIYSTAIETDEYILPLRNKTDEKTGIVYTGGYFKIKDISNTELGKYTKRVLSSKEIKEKSDPELIDFSKLDGMADYVHKQDRIDKYNKEILEFSDSVYKPHRNSDDVPEMTLFKDALELKGVDMDAYIPAIEEATGSSFNNDKRLLDKKEMTIKKMKGFADGLDMKMTLTIEDKDPNVPNPIGKPISIVINSGCGGY